MPRVLTESFTESSLSSEQQEKREGVEGQEALGARPRSG